MEKIIYKKEKDERRINFRDDLSANYLGGGQLIMVSVPIKKYCNPLDRRENPVTNLQPHWGQITVVHLTATTLVFFSASVLVNAWEFLRHLQFGNVFLFGSFLFSLSVFFGFSHYYRSGCFRLP